MKIRKIRMNGFAWLDLMATISIVALIAAFAIPIMLRPRTEECREETRKIQAEVMALPSSQKLTSEEEMKLIDNRKCPRGGMYSISYSSGIGNRVACSFHSAQIQK